MIKFIKSKKLLNIDNNAKTVKGQKYRYKTAILYLAPARISGYNVCPFADDCSKTCLNTAGRGQMSTVQKGRINKTLWFFNERETFIKQLIDEIVKFEYHCKNNKFKPCVRLNGTSDIKWENFELFKQFPNINFYDYTKQPKRMYKYINGQYESNYHLTFSLGSSNKEEAKQVLKMGGNIAVVFRNKKLPRQFMGYRVFNADKSDLRFKDPKNVIAGLYAKGKAVKDTTGFVQDVIQ